MSTNINVLRENKGSKVRSVRGYFGSPGNTMLV